MIAILKNIKRLCAKKHINIRELEAACGIGKGTIYHWDDVSPSIRAVEKVAKYFGVSLNTLVKEKEEE